ncbi:MaoC/PaaZ C-terminal domain-containing protein [Candidatus Pelagibacter sp. HIMB1695]|uniref:MaoC/PaaZ C-terminal domain-containing protein n=1 Tax=Candidatus Pelagibacter sp. HIMB1695 TaxID=3413364 RepID=UPI003F877EE7
MNNYKNILSLNDLKVGYKHNLKFKIDLEMMLNFEKISGDSNPLHTDKSFAISRGYKDRVVYGGLLIAKISQMLGMHLPGKNSIWTNLNLSFLKPLYINEEAELIAEIKYISEATSSIEILLKIFSLRHDVLKVRGKANTILINSKYKK